MGILSKAAKAVASAAKAVASTVTRGSSNNSSNKGSSNNSSNKGSSNSSSNKGSSNSSSNKTGSTWGSSKTWTTGGSSKAWTTGIWWISIWWISGAGWLNLSKAATPSSSTWGSSKTWGTSSQKWVTPSSSTPVASTASWTRLANGTVVPATYAGGVVSSSKGSSSSGSKGWSSSSGNKVSATMPWWVASLKWGWTLMANGTIVGWIGNVWLNTGIGPTNTLTSFRNAVTWAVVTPTSSKASNSAWGTVASNGLMSYDYTKNNAKWSPAISSMAWWKIGYADGSVYDPSTWKTTYSGWSVATKNALGWMSFGWVKATSVANAAKNTVANNWLMSYDYTKNNANWSPAVASWADWKIRYADGSIYDPKTWVTTNPNWTVVDTHGEAGKASDAQIVQAANDRANNASGSNSSTYNPVSKSGWTQATTQNKTNQSAMSVILNSLNWNNWAMQSSALDTWANRSIASQEGFTDNWDGSYVYIAPNGKRYEIVPDEAGNLAFQSQGGWAKGLWQNLNDANWNAINDIETFKDYIREQNKEDGINRSNVDNKDAVKWAQIVWTYNAPSGKEYDILEWTGKNEWKYWFVNINWEAQWFDNQDAALNYIDRNNPVWSKDLAKNTPLPEWKNDVNESIEDMNELQEEREEEDELDLDKLKEEWFEEWENNRDDADDIYYQKQQLVNQMFNDIDTFDNDINNAIDDLKQKSELLQDNERMRWARQRAAELAAQWYLTSEQVAQVANYSLSDYNKELEANALEAAKALAELRVNIAQKKQDYLNAIRTQQFANENDRQTQLNYASERFDKMLQYLENKNTELSQFYGNIYNNNLAMNAQNELWYESIIKQNQAQNIANDYNQQKAFTDTEYRRQYILNNITDANLHAYANQAINYLISKWNFIKPWLSNNDNKAFLANQISAVTDAARQLQLEAQKSLQS